MRVVLQVHIAGLIISPINNGKQSDLTYVNIIKHADEFDLPVVARRLFSDRMVNHAIIERPSEHTCKLTGCFVAACLPLSRYQM